MSPGAEKTSDLAGGVVTEQTSTPTPNRLQDNFLEYGDAQDFERELNVTEDDLLEAKEVAANYSAEDVREMMTNVYRLHRKDPNFPASAIARIEEFIGMFSCLLSGNEAIFDDPEKHEHIISEMKIQAALITNNSPYAAVRSVVSNKDDPSMPVSTIRAWAIGIFFCAACAFVNAFFSIRLPSISVGSTVPQLLAYPVGRLCAAVLPDVGFSLFGVRHSLNPGPFNKKEHMLITIIAGAALSQPYTNFIVWIQFLPQFFNETWVTDFGYQICIALAINFMGYGLAGLIRDFLVYPSYCLWPSSLVTIALNAAFHNREGEAKAVQGPFGMTWRISRISFFLIAFGGMFVYFWLPNYIFTALSLFAWMTWISPNNVNLATITGSQSGLGINPLPTFDWNVVTALIQPLELPFFVTMNTFAGAVIVMLSVVGMYYTNAFSTSYVPILSPLPYDRAGQIYQVTEVVNEKSLFDADKYKSYSSPYLSAGLINNYMFSFATNTAAITYVALYHHREVAMGVRSFIQKFRRSDRQDGRVVLDVHNRLMKSYKEVPHWWYFLTFILALIIGCVGLGHWPTNTSPAGTVYGLIMGLIFIVPMGIIQAMTGTGLPLNVLSEFIGGAIMEGNAVAMLFFKSFGYLTPFQALAFAQDLKIAHYIKIPPRVTFCAQIAPTIISSFIGVGVLNYQIHIKNVCTPDAPSRFYCPIQNITFTGAVLWGTVGPKRLWGSHGQYATTLVGFPLGVIVVAAFWLLGNKFPRNKMLRNIHPVVLLFGGQLWAPLNLSHLWPAVTVGAFSWVYIRRNFLSLWSKYNYVLSAAFAVGIALSALIQFFSVQYKDTPINWWGNNVTTIGCDGMGGCLRKVLGVNETFAPAPGEL